MSEEEKVETELSQPMLLTLPVDENYLDRWIGQDPERIDALLDFLGVLETFDEYKADTKNKRLPEPHFPTG